MKRARRVLEVLGGWRPDGHTESQHKGCGKESGVSHAVFGLFRPTQLMEPEESGEREAAACQDDGCNMYPFQEVSIYGSFKEETRHTSDRPTIQSERRSRQDNQVNEQC